MVIVVAAHVRMHNHDMTRWMEGHEYEDEPRNINVVEKEETNVEEIESNKSKDKSKCIYLIYV